MQTPEHRHTPALRFPEFSDNWEMKKLGEVAEIYDGTHQTPNYIEKGIPFYSVEHLTANNFEKTKYISEDVFEKENKRVKLEKGDILMTRIGDIGTARYIDWDVKASFYVSIVLIKQSKKYNSKYLNQYIATNKFQHELWDRTIHVAFPKKINLGEISNCLANFPTLPEQTKIGNFLTAVDTKIQGLRKEKALLEQYKKGMMQRIFSQTLRFKDADNQDFPAWEAKTLGELMVEHKTRNKKNAHQEVFSVAKEKGVINQIEHLGRSYASQDVSNYKVVFPDDVIYTKSPTSDFPFGIVKQNKLGRIGIVSVLYAVFRPQNKFLGYILDAYFSDWKNTFNYLNPIVQKGAKNTMNISNDVFLSGATINLPVALAEQTKIANFLSAIDEKIRNCAERLEKMEVWKKGLLQQMFV